MTYENYFTPAPWTTWKNLSSRHRPYNIYSGTKIIALVTKGTFECESEANADLIAVAPEMYRLLDLLKDVCRDNNLPVWQEAINNLLEKARGEKTIC